MIVSNTRSGSVRKINLRRRNWRHNKTALVGRALEGRNTAQSAFRSKSPADHGELMMMEIQMDTVIANASREHRKTAQRMGACSDIIQQVGASIIQTIHASGRKRYKFANAKE